MSDCDYCSEEKSILEDYESGEGVIRSLDIIFLPNLRIIRVKVIDNKGLEMNFGTDKRICYCPMCGKKLKYKSEE